MRSVLSVVAALLVVPALAMGATLTLSPNGNVVLPPGGTIVVDLIMNTTLADYGPASYPDPGVAGFEAKLIDRDNTGLITSQSRVFPGLFDNEFPLSTTAHLPHVLDPKSRNYGSMVLSAFVYPPSMFPASVSRITLQVSTAWNGTTPLRIGLTDLLLSDGWANPIEFVQGGPDLIITPEPASLLLLGLGGLLLRRRH